MGYPLRDHEMIEATMEEERDAQGLGVDVAAINLAYLKRVAPRAVDFINQAERFVANSDRRPRCLELGCGNGWVSWLLAEAGFEVWMCDFEANSLATGMHLEHPRIGAGKRFVTDARFAPFESGSIDVVVLKEFAHHVEDYRGLFREAARVLRPGGTLAMMEPTRSVWQSIREARDPDAREGHHIVWPDVYPRAIRGSGMEIALETPVYDDHGNTRFPAAWMKRRALDSIDAEHPTGNWLAKAQIRLFGGAQMNYFAHKAREIPAAPRPEMTAIDPATLIAGEDASGGYEEFPAVLAAAAKRLQRL
jgi:SAM-dependent methyltransferase